MYAEAEPKDGCRILVDRLWPRGLTQREAGFEHWAKELAPSTALRKWFGHDPLRWEAFQSSYRKELQDHRGLADFLSQYSSYDTITLLFAAKDRVHNHARVLQSFLQPLLEKA